jgi:thiol:disulfide interchange protein
MASAWATLLVYFLQMVFSYLLGQRYFPIPYNLKKFSVYIGLALVLYFMGSKIETASFALQFVLQNSLLLFYLAFIFFLERKTLRI